MRSASLSDKWLMSVSQAATGTIRWILNFALPPRCAGCGAIVEEVDSFCASCWTQIEFLRGGCVTCGRPLEATDAESCGACVAAAPRIARTRAAVVYDEIPRGVALKLKYGRKVALARTMARYMAPLLGELPEGSLIAPVPLHRRRLWERGFNQAAFVAVEISRKTGVPAENRLLERVKSTPPLKGMSLAQRRRTVAGAFRVRGGTELRGRTVVLVDDVLTTGSTADACAKALKKAGAERVELVSWARVIRPSQLA
ncbi:MAG: ComF family protein [Pseudomonadota bacterium]|nr:ComF family protein [Pseudomonadota bacterium]